ISYFYFHLNFNLGWTIYKGVPICKKCRGLGTLSNKHFAGQNMERALLSYTCSSVPLPKKTGRGKNGSE
ncbi:hypothetical protein, partial [Ruthenibacterium lactatiformans]|uniref:hypothetical protein n=1 Tax=Ruthenibacterium lactatiformans TaxID=1550024 RepID=UPI00267179AC